MSVNDPPHHPYFSTTIDFTGVLKRTLLAYNLHRLAHLGQRSKSPTVRDSNMDTPVDPRREIIQYLQTHPKAADTIDGILDWWIPSQRYENAKNEVQQALHELVEQGLIEEVVLGNGNRLYRLSSGK